MNISQGLILCLVALCLQLVIVNSLDTKKDLCNCVKTACSCRGGDIYNISSQIAPIYCSQDVHSLSLLNTNISQLDPGAFQAGPCASLTSLTIRESKVTVFKTGDFEGLTRITKLDIGGNNLTGYSEFMFSAMSGSLTTLIADWNRARSLMKKTFTNLVNLEVLNLSNNKIGYIQNETFRDCKKLRSLRMDNNILTDVDSDAFGGLDQLEYLDLRRNPFMKIAKDSFKSMPRIKTLLISHQDNFRFGGISELEEHTFLSLSKLRTLNITELRITGIRPLTFFALSELENLSLKNNRIQNISRKVFKQLNGLRTLDLSNNRIRCLMPYNFADLSYLKLLDLSGNYITYISNDAFPDLTYLRVLRLDFNPIHVVEPNAFCGLRSLRQLSFFIQHRGFNRNFLESNYAGSPFAKLSSNTTVIGLSSRHYKGQQAPCRQEQPTEPSSSTPSVPKGPLYCPVHEAHWLNEQMEEPSGSRMYLLIIVGICVGFLLIAFTVIMSYRAWSKQKMMNCDIDEIPAEKQEMIQHNNSFNGRPVSTTVVGPHYYKGNGGNGVQDPGGLSSGNKTSPSNGVAPTSLGYQPANSVPQEQQQNLGGHLSDEEATITTFGIV